ncbi:NAD(P)/FAD-dependent oxidoreductase [Zunongwangia sp. SCSIO 43204]|uniref:NAD(P)/FAD-dependent oxidoreductase n=1 Tax=Zunongwangia sp. SCSIO 43204 TaxID=2779359 RepID=UPI001CA8C3EE|nr:NAD(P)/FAD-dependent oxidoreductase [Zunongwangia sp. SCSIO 43204]UAB85737.1 NAD(P)/FAD-dependent oxidoreductase [Zunongwangia sp. SCSIO 43204]
MAHYDVLIVGGGAAGFFTAINVATFNPELKVAILERGKNVLSKVKISGGGRCNVTHAEFIPKDLSLNYPRGEKELLGPFHSFMTGDTIGWFADRGVELKTEDDGRMFPVTNTSETIIDCFLSETRRLGIKVLTGQPVKNIQKNNESWVVESTKTNFGCDQLVIATGSNPKMWDILKDLGHKMVDAVPSLFTFNIKDPRIKDLAGISTFAEVKITNSGLESEGPLLITHWGMSGPGILKLSAWGARDLNDCNYQFSILVNWVPSFNPESISEELTRLKESSAKQKVIKYAQFELPKRLWIKLVKASGIPEDEVWANVSKKQLDQLALQLCKGEFSVNGKSTFKDEFVTAGGVDLKEIDFKTFRSKKYENLYLAGEVLNIDAITGGFNFQNAWTGGFIAAKAIAGIS